MVTGFVDRAKGKTAISTQFMSQGAQFYVNSQDSIVAVHPGSQSTAFLLAQQQNRIITVASAGDGVRLPPAIPGAAIAVLNDAAVNVCNVYPASAAQGGITGGDQINGAGANVAFSLTAAAGTGATGVVIFYCFTLGVANQVMKKLALILAALLACIAPAHAVTLLTVPVTTAVTAQVGPQLQFRPGTAPTNMSVLWTVTYVSGGTTYAMWLQTSLDGGTTWCDVATASGTTAALHSAQNISFTATVALTACTDGAGAGLAIFGNQWRVKYTTTGTYVGLNLCVDAVTNRLTGQ